MASPNSIAYIEKKPDSIESNYFNLVNAMNRILVLFAHPAIHKSRVNVRMVNSVRGLASVTLHDLYETYPNFLIDAAAEQALLLQHDIIVFQHPFYWYSVPAIIREWCDLVLTYGFAYGEGGTRLKGKGWLHALSAGGPRAAYSQDGINGHTVEEFLLPFAQTAALCSMHFLPPFVVFDTLRLDNTSAIPAVAESYRHRLQTLRDAPQQLTD